MGKTNKYKQQEKEKTQKKQRKQRSLSPRLGKIGLGVRHTLDGSFIVRYDVFKRFPFVLYVIFWAVILIANGYNAEKKVRKIDQLNADIDDLRFEHIAIKSELMNYTRLSQIALSVKETGLKVSVEPPYKIFAESDE